MSSSSYLGHGAKYWADRYFELQTQTRLPDDYSAIEWRDKYLNLEKSFSLYQSQIADLRTEVANLREKSFLKAEPDLYKGHTAEYWFSETQKIYKFYNQILNELEQKNGKYDDLLDQLNSLENQIAAATYEGHDIVYWYNCAERNRIDANALRPALKKLNDNSILDGHDINYWHQLALSHARDISILKEENDSFHQKSYNYHRSKNLNVHFRSIIIAFVILVFVFLSGLSLGEGYFAPHFIPTSPYIESIQQKAETSGYSKGYRAGNKAGFSNGYLNGKKNGYEQGYSDGKSSTKKHWTAEDAKNLLESGPN